MSTLTKTPTDWRELDDRILGELDRLTGGRIGSLGRDVENVTSPMTELAAEADVDRRLLQARRRLLLQAAEESAAHWRSPLTTEAVPGLERFSYERSMRARDLEQGSTPSLGPEGWRSRRLLFKSAMAAWATTLTLLIHSHQGSRGCLLSHTGGYFETDLLLQSLSSASFSWRVAEVPGDIKDADILSFEPIRYTWGLDPVDLAAVAGLVRSAAIRARILIVDTTLCGELFPVQDFLRHLRREDLLVLVVRSGLKLDQCGLELTNVGLLDIFCGDRAPVAIDEFTETLELMRGVWGSGPDEQAQRLFAGLMGIDAGIRQEHAVAVMRSNAEAAAAIPVGGIFTSVSHPSLSPSPAALSFAPFLVPRLEQEDFASTELVLRVVEHELNARGCPGAVGSSFGFRHSRCEVIVPRRTVDHGILKFAFGGRQGPTREAMIDILQQVGGFESVRSLREAYPHVRLRGLGPLE